MTINFNKSNGLIPAIIQDNNTGKVLMLGYMNEEAFQKTQSLKRVTFFSRSKNRLWTKGEESGNYLEVTDIKIDCDNDTLLIKAVPHGPVCHTGADTCWNETNSINALQFLYNLEQTIAERKLKPVENSYTSKLFASGLNKIAQKVGEEATELVIEAKDNNRSLFLNEAADLLFHYMVLLQQKECSLEEVVAVLKKRSK